MLFVFGPPGEMWVRSIAVVEVASLRGEAGTVVFGMHGDVVRTLHAVAPLTALVRGTGPGTLPLLGRGREGLVLLEACHRWYSGVVINGVQAR